MDYTTCPLSMTEKPPSPVPNGATTVSRAVVTTASTCVAMRCNVMRCGDAHTYPLFRCGLFRPVRGSTVLGLTVCTIIVSINESFM